jgi:hypothetical protein
LAFKVRQLGLEQASIAVNVVAVRTGTGEIFIKHPRHS